MNASGMRSLTELMKIFFRLGATAFGGPAAHIAMMEDEVVDRKKWLTRERFLDLVGATNLIPGPNSTEMAVHIGYIRAGIAGLIVSGLSFILPAAIITGILAWIYVDFGALPYAASFLFGIKPAVVSIVLVAVVRLGKTAAKDVPLTCIGAAAALATLAGINEVLVLFSGGAAGIVLHQLKKRDANKWSLWPPSLLIPLSKAEVAEAKLSAVASAAGAAAIAGISLWKLGLFFLKIGSVLYGSGYVLIAFLEGGLVKDYGWLTSQQLLDAVAVGQFTPGPVLSTATFVGYIIAGAPGAFIATAAIFLPSFIFVLILNPIIPRLRASRVMSAFLDAVNVSAVGLMASVVITLAGPALTDWRAAIIAAAAAFVGWQFKLNAAWLVTGGALMGWALLLI
ncbi:MAG: chromate efflux transporter [Nitrospiraceae bacterium]|nr:MAG: chromate efflux transporter [Nitrospiraceae bacterium]